MLSYIQYGTAKNVRDKISEFINIHLRAFLKCSFICIFVERMKSFSHVGVNRGKVSIVQYKVCFLPHIQYLQF